MSTSKLQTCCTCAQPLRPPTPDTSDFDLCEKPLPTPDKPPRELPCCARYICSRCMQQNPRFQSYCPFCQVTSGPSSLPQGLRDPPAYSSPPTTPPLAAKQAHLHDPPPSYESLESADQAQEDVVHHLHPDDSIASLAIAYKVPAHILRKHNRLTSDHLVSARRTLSIPASHYKGRVSLSPKPVDSQEERERKTKLRRFMIGSKCHDYEVAEVYLRQADGDLERALLRWQADEQWERSNPLKGKGKRTAAGSGLSGQLR